MNLLESFYKEGFIKVGDYTLKSGKKSPLYFDFRSLIFTYHLFDRVVDHLKEIIQENFASDEYLNRNYQSSMLAFLPDPSKRQYLCGVPYGGMSFASIINDKLHKESPGWFGITVARQQRKNHGTGGLIFGLPPNSEEKHKIILVEDVITTGMSVYETIQELEKDNCEIMGIVSIFDRHESVEGFQFPRDKYPIYSLFEPSDILTILNLMTSEERMKVLPYLKEIMPSKNLYVDFLKSIETRRTNLVVAADNFKRPEDIIEYVRVNGDKIAILKLHHDILEFSDHPNDQRLTEIGFWIQLKQIKQHHGFLIMEDAKIADISKIALRKIKRINLYEGVDLVTIHGINAEALLNNLPEDYNGPQLVVVSDMSSETIWDYHCEPSEKEQYKQNCFQLAKYPHLFGFVTQDHPKINGVILMTPGISLTVQATADQKYRTPEKVIRDGSHLIIVGSGITDYDQLIREMTEKYRRAGFLAYKKTFLS